MTDHRTESNGRAAKGEAARRIMSEIGEGVTFAEVVSRMVDESNVGGSITEPTYYAIRRELWPHLARGYRPPEPSKPEPRPAPEARDWLSRLVKFGVAVEDVGGVGPARRMLDALEQLQRTLGGNTGE